MTFLEIAREVFADHPLATSDVELENILWEHTGFPGFFDGDPETVCRKQLQAHRDQIEADAEDMRLTGLALNGE